jgi:hypothetical protein
LHEVGTDARRVARDVARELGATEPHRAAIGK